MNQRRKKMIPIAVIGAAVRLPQADDLDAFWDHLRNARDLISEVPAARWDWQKHYDPQNKINTTQSKWGGFLDRIEQFDASFFRISNREALLMDPQQRILLELAWELFEDAGCKPSELAGSRAGVFIGACHTDYGEVLDRNLSEIDAYVATGTCSSILANRLSFFYNLRGPSLTVNTACSSSLVAVHQAVQSLTAGESETALAGGINLCLTPKLYIASSRANMLAKDGRCKTFAEGADGYVRGEGAGLVLMKPLDRAVAEKDHVYGVILGSALNHGGAVNSITVPNPKAQADLIAEALNRAGVRPERVGYIETHGTGTALGDPIELFGLKKAFQQASDNAGRPGRKHYCGLGSVKTNIGHLEPAAGIAGLIKVLLSLRHGRLPATLHLNQVNRLIDIKDSPFYFVTETKAWEPFLDSKKKPLPRVAGVSSFGFGGANAHVILAEYPRAAKPSPPKKQTELIVLSARSKEALRGRAQKLRDFCAARITEEALAGNPPWRDIAFTLQTGREEMEERLAIIADDFRDLRQKLSDIINGVPADKNVFQGRPQTDEDRPNNMRKEIRDALRRRDLARIAKHWIAGRAIPWQVWYRRRPVNRIPLPAYAFEHKSFWVTLKSDATAPAGAAASRPEPAPEDGIVRSPQGKIMLKIPGIWAKTETLAPAAAEQSAVAAARDPETRNKTVPLQPQTQTSASRGSSAIRAIVKEKLAQTLYADPAELDENKPFAEIGLDSILAVELVKNLGREFGIDLKASKLYDHASITLLTEYLAGILPAGAPPPATPEQNDLQKAAAPEKREIPEATAHTHFTATAADQSAPGDHTRDIAVIGMAGRFPGADNLDEFWQNLAQGRDCVTEIPLERWDINRHYSPDQTQKHKSYGKWGGFLKNIDLFDPLFFNISPAEAKIMDPHQRLVLEEAWKALEDAGYGASGMNRAKCGLFVGAMSGEEYFPHLYNLRSIMASRLAYFLNLKGPTLVLDTACSSALVAVHLACKSLREAETEMMIAGGVSLYLTEKLFLEMSQVKMLSPRGICRPFDDRADGIVPAEGVGLVVLKRLDKAWADHDRIYGVIRGCGINQDGRTNSITAPSLESQKNLEIAVYRQADIHPASIQYVEAHGTGTKLGDPIEIDALTEAFAEFTPQKQFCGIGSVKSNLGHPSAAAGMASLMKVLLAMQHGRIPATIHYERENSHIRFRETPFYVVSAPREWKTAPGVPRRAAVSCFGISGTNAHLVLEEFAERGRNKRPQAAQHLLVFSAKTVERLRESLRRFRAFLDRPGTFAGPGPDKDPARDLEAVAYTLQTGRDPFKERLALLASNPEELRTVLDRYLAGQADPQRTFWAGGGADPFGAEPLPAREDRRGIAALIFNKQLSKLARLWVQGYEIDWALLYGSEIPEKTSLPGYPLERKRYWKDEPGKLLRRAPVPDSTTAPRTPAEQTLPAGPAVVPRSGAAGRDPHNAPNPQEIARRMRQELADILGVEEKDLDEQTPLREMGLDSIFSVELMSRLNKTFQADVKAGELYNHPTVRDFSVFFADVLAESNGTVATGTVNNGLEHSGPASPGNEAVRKPLVSGRGTLSGVKQKMKRHLAEILSIDDSEFDEDTPLREFGLDSIFAVELAERLNKDLGMRIKASELYNYPTIARFAAYLESLAAEDPLAMKADRPAAETPQAPATTEPPQTAGLKRLVLKRPAGPAPEAVAAGRTLRPEPVAERKPECKPGSVDIAVVGMAGRFPGAPDLRAFWRNLLAGVDSVGSLPRGRWPAISGEAERRRIRGGFLEDIDRFDPLFFRISPMEAEVMDPQQRLFLEEAWKAFEDAGYAAGTLAGRKCGVFVGVAHSDYLRHMRIDAQNVNAFHLLGTSNSILGGRLSYLLDLTGPNLTVDTACSSSLVAVYEACRSIADGASELALAGGVSVLTTPDLFFMGEKAQMLSRDGVCRAFDRDADGFVLGEGAAAVVLKPLPQALRDRNPIYGVIKGWGVNQDGKSNGLTAPNGLSQARLEKEVYEKFGLDPARISYVETHGTGTKLGDPIEANALIDVFGAYTARKNYCAIGSVKTNIGHALAAAGMAGLIKALLCFKHRTLVPSLHFKNANPQIRLTQSPFFVSAQTQPWDPDDGLPRQAAVSSFGFSGTNCHLVLEEGPRVHRARGAGPVAHLIVLSAKTEKALAQKVKDLAQWLDQEGADAELEDLAYTLLAGRSHFDRRLALIVRGSRALRRALDELAAEGVDLRLRETRRLAEKFMKACPDPETYGRQLIRDLTGTGALPEAVHVRNLEILAQMYAAGVSLDWPALHAGRQPALLSMPVYPFQDESYWVARPANDAMLAEKPAASPQKSDYGNMLEKGEPVVFARSLGRGHPLLDQHRVQNAPLLPAVAYLDMAFAAIRQIDPHQAYDLAAVRWLQPAGLRGDRLDLRLTIKKQEQNFAFEIRSGSGGQAALHAAGLFAKDREPRPAPESGPALAEIMSRCNKEIGLEELYKRLAQHGVVYGPFFKTLDRILSGEEEVLGHWSLRAEQRSETTAYDMHPGVMDGALHTLACFNDPAQGKPNARLPFSVERVRFFRSLPAAGYVHVRQTGLLRYEVVLRDETGRTCCVWEDLALRENRDFFEDFFFYPQWVPAAAMQPSPVRENQGNGRETTLLIYAEAGAALAALIRQAHAGRPLAEIVMGPRSGQPEKGAYATANRNVADWSECLAAAGKVRTIYFLGGLVSNDCDSGNAETLRQYQEQGLLALFRLCKALAVAGLGPEALAVKIVTNRAREVVPGEALLPFAAGLHGWACSIAREYPRWTIQCLDLELDEPGGPKEAEQSMGLILQAPASQAPAVAALRRGTVFHRTLRPLTLPQPGRVPFRPGGVYLILGGAGGLGLVFSRYLAETCRARLVLVGRGPADRAKEEQFAAIRAAGGEVLYLTADAARFAELRQAKEQAEKQFGPIQGVVHSAIVLRDAALIRQDETGLRQVLAPKTSACVHLFNLFRDAPLDFMLFFSSGQSFSCKAGQSAYAAASVFEDEYARFIAQQVAYPVTVVNWGYWGGVGVVADEKHRKHLQALGVQSIEPQQGLEALRRILGQPLKQVMALKAGKEEQDRIGIQKSARLHLQRNQAPSLLREFNGETSRYVPQSNPEPWVDAALAELEELARLLLLDYFWKTDLLPADGTSMTEEHLFRKAGILAEYTALFRSLLRILARAGYIRRRQGMVSVSENMGPDRIREKIASLARKKDGLLRSFPNLQPQVELLSICLENYPAILQGKIHHLAVLFPNGSKELVERVYRGKGLNDYYARETGRVIRAYVEKRIREGLSEKIRILELGAGTGGASAAVLPLLADLGENLEYDYTDVSGGFVDHGRAQFGAAFPFMRFRVLDLEKSPESQGWESGSFDLAFASNVIHATRDIGRALGRIKTLLKRQGLLLVHEATRRQSFDTLIFGLTPGWWLAEDKTLRMPGAPLLEPRAWKEVLSLNGFPESWNLLATNETPDQAAPQSILLAESDGLLTMQEAAETELADRLREHTPARATPPVNADARREPAANAADSASMSLRERVIDYVKNVFSEVLKIKKNLLENDRTFEQYGIDSLVGLNLIAAFAGDLGKLPATLLFENLTIDQLGRYFQREFPAELEKILMPEAKKDPAFKAPGQFPESPRDSRAETPDRREKETARKADRIRGLLDVTEESLKAELQDMPEEELQGLLDGLLEQETHGTGMER